jgi:hypothetical protein
MVQLELLELLELLEKMVWPVLPDQTVPLVLPAQRVRLELQGRLERKARLGLSAQSEFQEQMALLDCKVSSA